MAVAPLKNYLALLVSDHTKREIIVLRLKDHLFSGNFSHAQVKWDGILSSNLYCPNDVWNNCSKVFIGSDLDRHTKKMTILSMGGHFFSLFTRFVRWDSNQGHLRKLTDKDELYMKAHESPRIYSAKNEKNTLFVSIKNSGVFSDSTYIFIFR